MRRLFLATFPAACTAVVLSFSTTATAAPILQPNDPILAIDTDTFTTESDYPAAEFPQFAFDDDTTSKYLNFGKYTSGLIVTPNVGPTVAQSLVLGTANDFPERDPTAYKLWGTNDAILATDNANGETGENWTLISEGAVALPDDRMTLGPVISFPSNTTSYSSYRVIFPTVKHPDPRPFFPPDSMQVSEIRLFDSANGSGDSFLDFNDTTYAVLLEPMTFSESAYPDNQAPRHALDGLATGPSESDFPDDENPGNAVDGTNAKYLNFGEENSGFIVTPASGPSQVRSFRIQTANDAPNRDPATWELYGTNEPIMSTQNSFGTGEAWTLLDSGAVALPTTRNTLGPVVGVDPSTTYMSFKMLFPTIRNAALTNSMQIGEVSFFPNADGSGTDILNAGDPILAIDATPTAESKYLNFGEENSGFIVTPATGATVVTSFQIRTANDAAARDPSSYELYGTNSPITSTDNSTGTGTGETWTLISSGTLDLPMERQTDSALVTFPNTVSYTSYKVLFPTVRDEAADEADSMQIGGIQLFDSSVAADADFDNDGDIDGNDFLIWQRGNGGAGTNATGDANGDNMVNGADLTAWRGAFGAVAAAGAVPEPHTAILALAALAAAAGVRRRK